MSWRRPDDLLPNLLRTHSSSGTRGVLPRETAPVAADVVAKALQAFAKKVTAITRPAISATRDMGQPLIDISAVDAQAFVDSSSGCSCGEW